MSLSLFENKFIKENTTVDRTTIPNTINAFIVLGIVVLSTVVFSLMNLFSNKDKLKKAGISIGSFLAVIILAFILSEGVETPMQDGKVLSAAGSRWVETGIRTFYLLTLIAVGIMIFNSVRKLIKK